MIDNGNRIISQLMEKALDCIEEYSEIQIIIDSDDERIVIDHEQKFIWNYKKTL